MTMFAGFARRRPLLPGWRWSTGAAQVVATPKWRDLVRTGPGGGAGLGWDLVTDDVAARQAGGRIMHLFGQVMDFDGSALPGVTVEIWQDGLAGFSGYGALSTDRFGGYRFRTIVPDGGATCPPHVDARLTPGKGRVLATRLYLLDDPRNERDWHFAALGPSRQAAVTLDPVARADGDVEAGFNFVL